MGILLGRRWDEGMAQQLERMNSVPQEIIMTLAKHERNCDKTRWSVSNALKVKQEAAEEEGARQR